MPTFEAKCVDDDGNAVPAGALGELVVEKSGVLNLGVEGMMLIGAVTGFAVTYVTGSPWIGVLAAAQLGVPVAAATLGTQQQLLSPGEPSALILGALLTVVATSVAGGIARRRQTSVA